MSLATASIRGVSLALCVLACTSALAQTAPLRDAVQDDKLLAPDGMGEDAFGDSVSLFGDRALVGAYGNEESRGAAYVYVRDGDAWVLEAKLVASDRDRTDLFGTAVALSADRAVVGAVAAGGFVGPGAAYVFVRDGSTWTQEARLSADDGEPSDAFGWSVALDGDRVLIGARFNNDTEPNSGAAYTFVRDGSVWTQEAKLRPDVPADGGRFGTSVSLTADRALVGSFVANVDGVPAGLAYVFRREGSDWVQEAQLAADGGSEFANFGFASALTNDRALVGARFQDNDGSRDGAAYLYARTGTEWALEATLAADDTTPDDEFGTSVALMDDHVLIGAPVGGAGAAYVFGRDGDAWVQQDRITSTDGENGDGFGWSVAMSVDRALVGAIVDRENGSRTGSAYVFSEVTAVADEGGVAARQALSPVFPNPAARRAALTVALDAPEYVRATVVDALGRQVAVLLDGEAVGETRLDIDTAALAPGVYLVRVRGESFAATRRLTVVR